MPTVIDGPGEAVAIASTAKGADEPATPGARSRRVGAFDHAADRFETRGELGRGGMGIVMEAYDLALKRPVAVKHMLSMSASDLARFEREAEITALLEHPGIVPIHDAGRTADGTPYYVMRRIDGEPLEQLVRDGSLADRLARVPNVLAACDAVAYAHARDVIHRDIKPSNILIGPFGETLLIDWGLARQIGEVDPSSSRASEPALTRIGSVAGTPGFMAPEQARGEELDARTDVFALGATLFYVLAGKLPFSASGGTEMIQDVGAGRAPEWGRLPDETPPELRAIVQKAMASDRHERYSDAGELAADLRRYVSGQLVGAYRYGRLEQLRRFGRRHRAAVAVGLVATLVLVVGLALSVRRIVTERDEANHARTIAEANHRDANTKRDQLIVQHALHLAATDPAAAIAVLRRLGPDSTEWRRAATVAGAAAAHGIPFGFSAVVPRGDLGFVEVSPDSRIAITRPLRGARLTTIDLVARTRREWHVAAGMQYLVWLDTRWLLGATRDAAVVIDSESETFRSIPLPGELSVVRSDRRGRGYVVLRDQRVYAVDARSKELGAPITHGAREFYPIAGGRAIVEREHALELWSPDRSELLTKEQVSNVIVRDQRVAARVGDRVCTWKIATTLVLEQCSPTRTLVEAPIALSDGLTFLIATDGIDIVGGRRRRTIGAIRATVSALPNGIAFAAAQGEIELWDSAGRFVIGGGKTAYRRLAQSDDERFLVAITTTGDLHVWDLPRFRPKSFAIDPKRRLFAMTPRSLWTFDTSGGVYRRDRATGEEVLVAPDHAFVATVDAGETWLVTSRPIAGELTTAAAVPLDTTLLNLQTDARIRSTGESFSFDHETAYGIDAQGVITQLRADGTRERLGAFPGEVVEHAFGAACLTGFTAGRELCRFELATRQLSCVELGLDPFELALDLTGTTWLLTETGLWRWDGGAAERVWPELTLTRLVRAEDNLLAVGSSALVDLTLPGAQPVAIDPMLAFSSASNGRLVGTTAGHQIAVVDIETGLAYELPLPEGQLPDQPVSSGTSVAVIRTDYMRTDGQSTLMVFELAVPTEPVELRAWLATVTNALPIGDTDVVAWP